VVEITDRALGGAVVVAAEVLVVVDPRPILRKCSAKARNA
jgi:hypothetical protein